MFRLFCRKCSVFVGAIEESIKHGSVVVKVCPKCKTKNSYMIRYKATSRIIREVENLQPVE